MCHWLMTRSGLPPGGNTPTLGTGLLKKGTPVPDKKFQYSSDNVNELTTSTFCVFLALPCVLITIMKTDLSS